MTDWTRPIEVMEGGDLVAVISREGDRYTVVNHDRRVSSTVDTFKDAAVMRKWLAWAYPEADTLIQGGEILRGR